MKRRTKEKSGFVNFPVDSTEYLHTKEGGLVVKLYAIERDDEEIGLCCGYNCYELMTESYVGHDRHYPVQTGNAWKDSKRFEKYIAEMFPSYANPDGSVHSIPLLASVLLGTTGWSGFNERTERYWRCTFEDLAEEGKQLYRWFQENYPTADLYLVTFLDT